MGTGPFKWAEWKKGEYVRLAKFEAYVSPANDGKPDGMVGSKRPLVDGIKFMVIPDASTVKAGLLSGALGYGRRSPPDLISEFKDERDDAADRRRATTARTCFYFQTRDKVLSNARRASRHGR
ncbi:ABC transporter substrate-binding protein [Ensifer canadensis]